MASGGSAVFIRFAGENDVMRKLFRHGNEKDDSCITCLFRIENAASSIIGGGVLS